MKITDLKEGHYYQGKNGDVRRYRHRAYYDNGLCCYRDIPANVDGTMRVKSFARWAVREVVARWEAVK